jgi:protein SCO1/2
VKRAAFLLPLQSLQSLLVQSLLLLLLLLQISCAHAGPLALPPAPQAGFVQRLDARLPLAAGFTDDTGAPVRLAHYFAERPVVLVLGYYQCPNLCTTLMEGVLHTLAGLGLPRDAYRIVEVSIDPAETPALAARKKLSYQPMLGRRGGDLHLLTGTPAAIAQLAASAGLRYSHDEKAKQYAHPAGFLVATPDGRIARYFMGVDFNAEDVRLALVEASSWRIGSVADRLWLLCAHFDPAGSRYSIAAMSAVRLACLLVLLLLAGWIAAQHMRQRRRG